MSTRKNLGGETAAIQSLEPMEKGGAGGEPMAKRTFGTGNVTKNGTPARRNREQNLERFEEIPPES